MCESCIPKFCEPESLVSAIHDRGFALVEDFLPRQLLRELGTAFPAAGQDGTRNLLSSALVRQLASSPAMLALLEPVLGDEAFAVRAILFNKLHDANGKVALHQDTVIAVQGRTEVPGWEQWSVKEGVHHVRPPAEVLSRMLVVRIHLDDCSEENGPLQVIPGSHQHGVLSTDKILATANDGSVTCIAHAGDVLLMRPLLLHASSAATAPTMRRVIHIEFAAEELPNGLQWNERV